MDWKKQDEKATREEVRQESDREESTFSVANWKGHEAASYYIIFMKSLKKKWSEKDTYKTWLKEFKRKEKVTNVATKEDVRKLLPKKLTRATPSSAISMHQSLKMKKMP